MPDSRECPRNLRASLLVLGTCRITDAALGVTSLLER